MTLAVVVSYKGNEQVIAYGRPTTIIGERINPTNRKKLSAELEAGSLEMVKREAEAQRDAGAHLLDVNVGAPGVNETEMLPKAVQAAAQVSGLPICIDSANPEALEAALAVYDGKALVNSVTGEEASLERVLPVVARYNASVIGLTMDDTGIPPDAEARVRVAAMIIERAAGLGISKDRILIDPLTMAVATDSNAGAITLEATRRIVSELGVGVVLGASNVSFGLPERETVNAAFLAMAICSGMAAVISNPLNRALYKAILASDVLVGRDDFALRYIEDYRKNMS